MVTFGNTAVSRIYANFFLEHIIEAAMRLAKSHSRRDAGLSSISEETRSTLHRLLNKCGRGCEWPDVSERGEIFDLALGPSFVEASSALRRAILAALCCKTKTEAAAHSITIDDAANTMRDLLAGKDSGDVEALARRQERVFSASVAALRDPAVRKAFGNAPKPDKEWPYTERAAPGDTAFLDLIFESEQRSTCNSTNQYYFALIQRTAVLSAMTIDLVLGDDSNNARSQELINTAYRWERSLNSLVPVQAVVRAWREPAFRASLTPQEQAATPSHPAGDLNTQNAGLGRFTGPRPQAGGQTFTVNNEVCCSTTPSVSCMSHCPSPSDDPIIVSPTTYPCCTHHC